jgi:type I restriction enzyme M protein
MLSEAAKYLRELNPDATLVISGQDYNAEAYAICGSDMLIKGEEMTKFSTAIPSATGKPSTRFPARNSTTCLPIPPSA